MWSKSHGKLIVLMFLGLTMSMPSCGDDSAQPPYLTITDVLRKVEDLRSGWVPPSSKDHPHDSSSNQTNNNTRTTRQDEGDADVDPVQTDAFQQITNSFGGILAQRLIGNILAPQTGDVREFLGGIAQNVVKFAFPKQTTTTTPKTSYLYQGTRIQQVDRQPGFLLNNVNPGYRPNRVPAPGQAVPVSGQREPVRVPVQSVQVVRLDQIAPKTTPPPQKYFWGGDGGAVGKLVNGLVSGVANELGLVNRTQQSPPVYYLQGGGGGGVGQGQVGNINGGGIGLAQGSSNNITDVDTNSPTTESGGGEDESDENRADINQNRKLSKFEWKLKHKYIPLSI